MAGDSRFQCEGLRICNRPKISMRSAGPTAPGGHRVFFCQGLRSETSPQKCRQSEPTAVGLYGCLPKTQAARCGGWRPCDPRAGAKQNPLGSPEGSLPISYGASPIASALVSTPGATPTWPSSTYHGWLLRPLKTGTFYFARKRNFLLCSKAELSTLLRHRSCRSLHVAPWL